MREIKFRAWDKIGKQGMLGWSKIIETGIELFFKDNFGFELMQFTGLKDKQGKEIYEGDIVKQEDTINEVYFHKGAFKIGSTIWNPDYLQYPEGVEVIGNIYETPELLKEPK